MTTPVASPPAAAVPTRRRFTVAEYYALADAGILSENDRVELLDGDIIVMPPIGDWHAGGVKLFANTFPSGLAGSRYDRRSRPGTIRRIQRTSARHDAPAVA